MHQGEIFFVERRPLRIEGIEEGNGKVEGGRRKRRIRCEEEGGREKIRWEEMGGRGKEGGGREEEEKKKV